MLDLGHHDEKDGYAQNIDFYVQTRYHRGLL